MYELLILKQINLKSNIEETKYSYKHIETFIIFIKNDKKGTYKGISQKNYRQKHYHDFSV